jgi:hypothetical protein
VVSEQKVEGMNIEQLKALAYDLVRQKFQADRNLAYVEGILEKKIMEAKQKMVEKEK